MQVEHPEDIFIMLILFLFISGVYFYTINYWGKDPEEKKSNY